MTKMDKSGPPLGTLSLIALKAGFSGLGGGFAIVPYLKKEIVSRHAFLDDSDFFQALSTAQCSPGSLAVNCCVGIGYMLRGMAGAAVMGAAVLLPSIAGVLLLLRLFSRFVSSGVFSLAFRGFRLGSAALIATGMWMLVKPSVKSIPVVIEIAFWVVAMRVFGASPTLVLAAAFLLAVLKRYLKRERQTK